MYISQWKLNYENYKELPCTAPCSMYSVLLEHGLIKDPFYGLNELEFIKALGKRMTILHIHDNKGSSDDHMIPYTQNTPGGVDWNGFVEGLSRVKLTE